MSKQYDSFSEAFNDPDLFNDNEPGDYNYETTESGGKSASGVLSDESGTRNNTAQRNAGGELRRGSDNEYGADDGGHLIAARFGGSSEEENLTAQNRNLNRSQYKSMEDDWAKHLEAGDKVYVCTMADDPQRPNAYTGYAIYETPDGKRTAETFNFDNESKYEKARWEEDYDEGVSALEAEGKMDDEIYYPSDDSVYESEYSDEGDLITYPTDQNLETSPEYNSKTYLADAANESIGDYESGDQSESY